MNRLTQIAATLGLLALAPAPAPAALLVLNHSGLFTTNGLGEPVTLGGIPLPDGTPFSYSATFDSTNDIDLAPGFGLFPATVVFDITGFGTFASAPGANVNVRLQDPSISGGYVAGLSTLGNADFAASFSAANPAFDADNPTPSVLSGVGPLGVFNGTMTISLANGAGDLVIPYQGIDQFGPTATIASASPVAAPEPSTLALAAMGGVGFLGYRRRLRKRT